MPLSEFYRMTNGKVEGAQQKTTTCVSDVSFVPDNECVELVWENGQIMMQGQSSKGRKSPISSNFQFHMPRFRDKDMGNATTSKMGKFETIESIFSDIAMSIPSGEMGLSEDDDMVPWLSYPIDDTLQQDYCSDLLPELSGVTVNEPSTRNSFAAMDKRDRFHQTVSDLHNVSEHTCVDLEQGNASQLSSLRASQLYPWSLQQGQTLVPSLASGVSDIISSNTGNTNHAVCGDSIQGQSSASGFPRMKMQKQDSGLPSSSSSLLNFSHFSRPAAIARANLQNIVSLSTLGSSGVQRMADKDKGSAASSSNPAESELIDPNSGLQKEMGFHSQPNVVSAKLDSRLLVTKPLEESHPTVQSDAVCREDAVKIDKCPNPALGGSTTKGAPDSEKTVEPVVASSSVCSGNSAERASNDLTDNLKRKCRDTEESECQSEDIEEESVGVKKTAPGRGGTGSKRSRAAEVHNLSERRRRDRINEKMRALQELIPNCNKVDKASMLDEAIEYLKTLQLQVQIMSMGAGLWFPPMMLPTGMQHIHPAHLPHFSPMSVGLGMGMGMGMGFGMGMLDMNGGSRGCPMIPVPPMQGAHFPSHPISGPTSFQGIAGSNLQVFGHPRQGLPMPVLGAPLVPLSGRPPTNSVMGLNALGMGVHVEVSNTAPSLNSKEMIQNTNSKVMHNADADSSMKQTSSQFQATDEGFDQSALVQKNDPVPEVGCSAAVNTTNANDTVPIRAAGCD